MTCLYPLRLDMRKIAKPENVGVLPTYLDVPCGHCIKCLLSKNYEWQFRGYCEYLSRGSIGTFLTLTYDDKNNPMRVSKRDVQLFIKRLKKEYGDFSYMCTSEYGEEKMRPHYHLSIFGLDLFGLAGKDKNIKLLTPVTDEFRFDFKLWKYGFCHCKPLDSKMIKYGLKYLLKGNLKCGKYKSYNDMLEDCGFEPLFFLKSQGIGAKYFESHIDEIQEKGGLVVNGSFHGLPMYYSKKYDCAGTPIFSAQWYKTKQYHTYSKRDDTLTSYEVENLILGEMNEKKSF